MTTLMAPTVLRFTPETYARLRLYVELCPSEIGGLGEVRPDGGGLLVTELGNTKAANRTTVVLYSPKLYTLKFLTGIFGITRSPQILIKPDPLQSVDIEIRLGSDWINQLPPDHVH